ncbi:hypothetical protein N7468_005560 [Penicillium chermesinum]|uniref:Endoplasmic reticulum lectin n=1 Tax=Penicillium chermesinum TaxID=63820 RepID=A0A9W9NZI8_9EURO|nr:uncharacterized protein N7468_005560 [Penicillium chermesinum]KAJ5232604.1 hypothetical protein N7468_005560 [Penicillium chermesinum]
MGVTLYLLFTCFTSTVWAAKRPFNIQDDVLAYPQNLFKYQVLYPQEYILDAQAQELLENQVSLYDEVSSLRANAHGTEGVEAEKPDKPKYAYEEMILNDRRLLCQIPQVAQDELNATGVTPTSEADEKKELARATDREGLNFFASLRASFHALPPGRGVSTYPPTEDPDTHSFILGQFPGHTQSGEKSRAKEHDPKNEVAELHTKGGSRYLVQHLRGGTRCDLTGRERRIEVQFHCHPQSTDQIGWIKELTTCTYLMVIYTPRLCDDVAFLPPQQDEVHSIECREILQPEDVPEWEAAKEWFRTHQLAEAAADHSEVQMVGGIEIGGHKLVGMEGKTIEKGRVVSAGEEHVEIVAKRENGEIRRMSKQAMKKFDLDPEKVEDMRKQLEEYAGDNDWTLEVVASNGVIKFQGIVADEDDEEEGNVDPRPHEETAPRQADGSHAKTEDRSAEPGDRPSQKLPRLR